MDRVKKTLLTCLACVMVVGFALGLLSYIFGPELLSIYASPDDKDVVIKYGMIRMSIIMMTYFTCGTMDTCVGSIRGLGYSVLPMIVSLLGACGLRILWIYTVFTKIPTLECLYASYPISWTVTTIAHLICIFFIFRKVSQRLSSAKLA